MRESIQDRLANEIRDFLRRSDVTMDGKQVRHLANRLADMFVFNNDTREEWYDLVSLPGNLLLRTHPTSACNGDVCCVHNPSDHHMVNWPQQWDPRGHMMHRLCEHDLVHPDPDDLRYQLMNSLPPQTMTLFPGQGLVTTHFPCDGCCLPG